MASLNEIRTDTLNQLKLRQELCVNVLDSFPKGRLTVSEKNGRQYFELYVDGARTSIHRDDPLVTTLSDRKLVEATYLGIRNAIRQIESGKICTAVFDPNEILLHLPKAYQHPSSEVFQKIGFQDARTWAVLPYNKSTRHPERLTIRTKQGVAVRTRIESGIMDIYEELGIPVRYEEACRLPSGKTIYPDFRLLIPGVLRTILHEHCGLMNSHDYVKNEFLWKHDQYSRAGLLPGRDVLFTFDGFDGEVDYSLLRNQIREFIDYNRSLV